MMGTHHTWLRKWSWKQDLALLMSVVMLVSSFTVSVASGAGQPSAAQITEPLKKSYQDLGAAMVGGSQEKKVSPEQVHDKLKELFQSLEVAERKLPRDTFDIQAIIQKIGRDPVKLYEWVRDETFLVPYRGVLRGDKGVLMDRLGNSLDRSLLVHALLRSVGQEVRLAHGSLSKEQAMDLMQKARPIPKGGVLSNLPSSRKETDEFMEKYAKQYQINQAELRKQIDKVTLEQQRMVEEVTKRVVEQARAIASAVGKPSEKDVAISQGVQVEALRDHWWVQWKKESTWVDLDTALPDAKPGKALANAQETIAPDKLPASLHHAVQIRIIIEQWEGNKLKEVPVLTHNLRPSDLLGEHIALRHIPLKWPKDLDLLKEKDPLQHLKTTVLTQNEWLPVLNIGSTDVFKFSFTDSGETKDKTVPPIAEGFGNVGKNLFGRPGQPPGRAPKKDSRLTAEWIDYEIRLPGQPVRTIRREIFDLIGPAARSTGNIPKPEMTEARRLERGLTLLGETEILPLVSQLSPQFVEHLMTKNMLANREVMLSLLGKKNQLDSKSLNDQFSKLKPLSTQLFNLSLARREWSRFRADVYLDRPNILSYHKSFRLGAKGKVLQRDGFDIVANDVAVRTGSETTPFLIRLEQGVLDTNAEALLVASSCRKRDEKSDCGQVENTAEIFAKASTQWLAVSNPLDSAWKDTELPGDVRVRIDQDLAVGFSVMVPTKAVTLKDHGFLGWWRVDPKSGQTLGMGPDGSGQAATELDLELKVMVMIGSTLFGYYVCLVGFAMAGDNFSRDERRDVVCILTGAIMGGALIYSAPITLGKIIFALVGAFVAGYSL